MYIVVGHFPHAQQTAGNLRPDKSLWPLEQQFEDGIHGDASQQRLCHMSSRDVSYQPMDQRPLVPESRMLEVLAKHKKGVMPNAENGKPPNDEAVTPGPNADAGAASAENTPAICWGEVKRTGGITAICYSLCERFSVDMDKSTGHWRYTAWKRPNENLGCFDSPAEARAACEVRRAQA